jgi:hypothetical protein
LGWINTITMVLIFMARNPHTWHTKKISRLPTRTMDTKLLKGSRTSSFTFTQKETPSWSLETPLDTKKLPTFDAEDLIIDAKLRDRVVTKPRSGQRHEAPWSTHKAPLPPVVRAACSCFLKIQSRK